MRRTFCLDSDFVIRKAGPTTVKVPNAILAQDRRAGWGIEHGEVHGDAAVSSGPLIVESRDHN